MSTADVPVADKRQYPKSANFALPVAEKPEDDEERPQSARAATRSWSASGGTREATFKKRRGPPRGGTDGKSNAIGFATVLSAASFGSVDMDEANEDESGAVALWLEGLVLKLENEAARVKSQANSPLIVQRSPSLLTPPGDMLDSARSADDGIDLEKLSMQASGVDGWTSTARIGKSPAKHVGFGTVLGIATEADQLADDLATGRVRESVLDAAEAAIDAEVAAETERKQRVHATPPSGKYGKLAPKDGATRQGGDTAQQRYASWSESGGVREGAFKKKKGHASAEDI